jgi:perosamine synthetase
MNDFIPVYQPDLSGNELQYTTDCITSSWISSLGKYVDQFEAAFAQFCGTKYAISVANGTVALHLALVACDIGPGDEVIIPTLTFVATANAVKYTGATPVFVDSEPQTWTIDPKLIEAKITPRTKAIMPVHLYGHPANMDEILALAAKYKLTVIEDAAEAHGAQYRNCLVGNIGDVGCFSFYGNKIITTGEGGMLTTNNGDLAQKIRLLKDHGMSKEKRYWHPVIGYNYRMTNIEAAIGLAQLERIQSTLARKREVGQLYNNGLKDCPNVVTHPEAEWAKNVYWMYSILLTDQANCDRDGLMAALREQGIDSRPFFYPIHQMPPYKEETPYPVADDLSRRGINLPSYPTLINAQIQRICDTVRTLSA